MLCFCPGDSRFNTDACIQGPVLGCKAICFTAPSAHVAWEVNAASPSWKSLASSQVAFRWPEENEHSRSTFAPKFLPMAEMASGGCVQPGIVRQIARQNCKQSDFHDMCKYKKIKNDTFFFSLNIIFYLHGVSISYLPFSFWNTGFGNLQIRFNFKVWKF